MIKKIKKEVGCSFKENIQYMDQTLPVEKSFDIIRREMEIGGKESVFYYIDGFIKDEAMLKIMDSFLSITAEDLPQDAETFSKQKIPYVEVDVPKCFDDILRNVLSGTAVFFVDGYDAALCMDCRSYPARGVDEPDKDKSLRGSRDGFVETIVFNTALMRRRSSPPAHSGFPRGPARTPSFLRRTKTTGMQTMLLSRPSTSPSPLTPTPSLACTRLAS